MSRRNATPKSPQPSGDADLIVTSVTLPKKTLDRLDRYAALHSRRMGGMYVSRSGAMRFILSRALDAEID